MQWLSEIETSIPSIVAVARDVNGRDLEGVTISIDDQRVPTPLDGRAVELDPGWRIVRFERPGFATVRERVLLRQGEKNRTVLVALTPSELGPSMASKASPVQRAERAGPEAPAQPAWPFILAGAGVVMAGAGMFVAASGHSDASDLQRDCAPSCSESDARAALTKWIVGWSLIGVGATAAGIGTWFALQPTGARLQGRF